MRKACLVLTLAAAFFAGFVVAQRPAASDAGDKKSAKSPMIGHMVYFSLKDNSPKAKQKLVAACKKYLTKHDGEVYFGAGVLAESLKREVNDTDWDVALHIVFRDMKAHDTYQTAKRHIQFIDENKDNWSKVRVFDSLVN